MAQTAATAPRTASRRAHGTAPGWVALSVGIAIVLVRVGLWVAAALAWGGAALAESIAGSLFPLTMTVVGVLVVLHGTSRGYGWLMLAYAAVAAVGAAAEQVCLSALAAGDAAPAVAVWLQDLYPLAFLLGPVLLPALFPDGRAASPRWRVALIALVVGWSAYIVLFAFTARPAANLFLEAAGPPPNPLGLLRLPLEDPLALFGPFWLLLIIGAVVVGIGSLITRWRRADSDVVRQQIRWVVFAFSLALVALVVEQVLGAIEAVGVWSDPGVTALGTALAHGTVIGLGIAWGIAVLRYRLHALDLVVNRTLVYGALTILIALVYIVLVMGLGALVPVEQPTLALGATVLVAVGFAPVRTRVQAWVNRAMFGLREDPYTVMAALSQLLTEARTPQQTLQTMAETVGESLKLSSVVIEVDLDDRSPVLARHGTMPASSAAVVPLRVDGELIGRLRVAPRSAADQLSPRDMALLADVAGPAAAVARTLQLTERLRASREQLVRAREDERRRIRRDLHDGLGPSLAAQTFQLDEVLETLQNDPDRANELVTSLKHQNQDLVADVRRLVYALRPPTLDDLGLVAALETHAAHVSGTPLAGGDSLHVTLTARPDPLPAIPAAAETALFHIVREAVTNAARHAHARACTVTLVVTSDEITATVRDDGVGIPVERHAGLGLRTMRERAEELGGTLDVTADRTGTSIRATIPRRAGDVATAGVPGTTAAAAEEDAHD